MNGIRDIVYISIAGTLGGALVIEGGIYLVKGSYSNLTAETLPPTIESIDWQNEPGVIRDPALVNDQYLYDINKDGLVDAIGSAGKAVWYTSDWKKGKMRCIDAVEMTPEIRQKASEIMQAQRDLGQLLLEERWSHIDHK